jgi:hypothetical protein
MRNSLALYGAGAAKRAGHERRCQKRPGLSNDGRWLVLLQTLRETAEACKGATLRGQLESLPAVPAAIVDGEERTG